MFFRAGLLLFLCGCTPAAAAQQGESDRTSGIETDTTFSTLCERALAQARSRGALDSELELPPGHHTVKTSCSFPETLVVRARPGTVLTPVSGATLTIPRFAGDDSRHFDVSRGGRVRLTMTSVVKAVWFTGTPTGIDDAAGLQAALDAAVGTMTNVELGPGVYAADGLNLPNHGNDVIIRGVNRAVTTVRSRTGATVFDFHGHYYTTGIQIRDLGIDGSGQARIASAAAIAFPVVFNKDTLRIDVTIDDRIQPTSTVVLNGSYPTVSAVVQAIGSKIPGASASGDRSGTRLTLQTRRSGPRQSITLRADSTAAAKLGWPSLAVVGHGAAGDCLSLRNEGDGTTFRINIEQLYLNNCGGRAVYIPDGFSNTLRSLDVSNVGGNGIEIKSGNTTGIYDCFVRSVGSRSTAYRIHGGQVTMINNNGADGARWGEFGDALGEDGANSTSIVTMIGCNVEGFTNTGVLLKGASSLTALGCKWDGSSQASATAIRSIYSRVTLDQGNRFFPPKNGWSGGAALHSSPSPSFLTLGWSDLERSRFLTELDEGTRRVDSAATVAPAGLGGGTNAIRIPALLVPSGRLHALTGQRIGYAASPPTAAPPDAYVWYVGDILFNSAPDVGQPLGWVCIAASSAKNPLGKWVPFGKIGK